jgi:23S rRNA pseudouridine1911/1915/1917 synthase
MLNSGWTYRDTVPQDASGHTALQFYAGRYPHSSAQRWGQRLLAGQIRMDGERIGPERLLTAGQELTYNRPPWREAEVPGGFVVLHDDADLLAVAKPSGLPTMPGGDFLENTLLHLVRRAHGATLAPLHRLGRATSGIVLFARSLRARRELSADLREGRLRKEYRALVSGADMVAPQTIRVPIGLLPYEPLGRIHGALATGKPSCSLVRLLERRGPMDQALVAVEIPTGRAHQIRIHLAAVGHPLAGDPLYVAGGIPVQTVPGQRPPLPGDGGYHLHAWRVDLIHPEGKRPLTLTCVPPPILCCAGEMAPSDR